MPEAQAEARRLQQAVLVHGLDGHETDGLPRHIGPVAWAELLAWAQRERVVGLLASAASMSVALTDQQVAELDQVRLELIAVNLLLEGSARQVADLLGEAGIDWRILKGMATAQLIYPEPSLRTSGDVDILVSPSDLARCLEVLSAITTEQAPPQHGPIRTQTQKEWQLADTRGVEIDVHQAIEGSLIGSRLPIGPLLARPQEVDVAGRTMLAMSTPALFVHAVVHLTTPCRLSTVADIARLARQCDPSDPLIDELIERTWARHMFVWGLQRSTAWVPLPPAWDDYMRRHELRPATQRRLDWIHADQRHVRLVNILTGRRRIRRGAETLWPSEEFLDYHGMTRRRNFLRQLRGTPLIIPPPR